MFEKIVKFKLVEDDIKLSDLARIMYPDNETSGYSNLRQKMKRDNFSEKEMQEIADALNCELKITLVPKVN